MGMEPEATEGGIEYPRLGQAHGAYLERPQSRAVSTVLKLERAGGGSHPTTGPSNRKTIRQKGGASSLREASAIARSMRACRSPIHPMIIHG